MASRVGLVWALPLALAACGRLSFDARDDAATGDAPGASGDALDAGDRPNVAFVSAAQVPGDFGGLAGGDTICGLAAMDNGLPGTFVALLSTSTTDALSRITGSRGWVRTDGEPLIDLPTDLLTNGHQLNILDHAESGVMLPLITLNVWTGTTAMGKYDATNGACNDWTAQGANGGAGFYSRSAPFGIRTGQYACTLLARIYCFETGHVAAVTPHVTTGNIAFVSTPAAPPLSSFDAQCQADANAAGLPGTYLAGVATTTATIQSRFATASAPYRRPDGTQVSTNASEMFDGTSFLAPLNQYADGTYIANAFTLAVATGASSPTQLGTLASTCSDWSVTTGAAEAGTAIDARSAEAWSGTTLNCNTPAMPVYCFQQ